MLIRPVQAEAPAPAGLQAQGGGLHVALIMDGNGRWATMRGRPRLAGHTRGMERVRDVVRACPGLDIAYLTLFAFSTENWRRAEAEVQGLMRLFRRYIKRDSARLVSEGVRVRFIGARHRLDRDLVAMMAALEEASRDNDRLHLTIAIDYGGRDEITRAARRIAEAVAAGRLPPAAVSERVLGAHLDTADLPEPDLIVRTSGECRTSNFLPWQAAYAEYAFVDAYWPDFTAELLADQLTQFRRRTRRFGALGP